MSNNTIKRIHALQGEIEKLNDIIYRGARSARDIDLVTRKSYIEQRNNLLKELEDLMEELEHDKH